MADFDIHPDMADLLAAKKNVPLLTDPEAARVAWNAYGESMKRPYPIGMVVRDTVFPPPPCEKREIAVRIYRPVQAKPGGPCLFYLHGGAFIKGSLESGDVIAWGVADQVGCTVISVDYRLAPDFPYPAALEDCYAVLCHVVSHAAELGVDGARIGVWGDSAGANLSAALCLLTRDRNGPRVSAQALNYPCLTDELTSDSYHRYAESPGLRTEHMNKCWDLYLHGQRPTEFDCAAPLKARTLSNLPPAHVHIAEIDPLADDGRGYAKRLREAGNEVEFRVASRMIHGFLRARFAGPDAAAEFAAPCQFLRLHLGILDLPPQVP
jgi:acetyl esterase